MAEIAQPEGNKKRKRTGKQREEAKKAAIQVSIRRTFFLPKIYGPIDHQAKLAAEEQAKAEGSDAVIAEAEPVEVNAAEEGSTDPAAIVQESGPDLDKIAMRIASLPSDP
jgi:hypothetical protein